MPENRSFPSFFMFRDKEGNWRWNFSGPGGRVIAASSQAYARGAGCIRAIQLLKGANDYPVYGPPGDINRVRERVAEIKTVEAASKVQANDEAPAAGPKSAAKKAETSGKTAASTKVDKAK